MLCIRWRLCLRALRPNGVALVNLDSGTLIAALAVVCAVLASLLAITWIQNRAIPAFGIWTFAFSLCAIASVIVGARNWFPGLLALDIANTLRLLAFGVAWQGGRSLGGRKLLWWLAVAPAILWALACIFFLGEEIRPRVLLAAPFVAAFSFALALELWRAVPREWGISHLAVAILGVHGAVFAARFMIAVFSPASTDPKMGLAAPLHPVNLIETLAVGVAIAFLLFSVTREAIGAEHREQALRDPLTGVRNRRGFAEEVEGILARARRSGNFTALLLIDLDHFKSVNDRFGHQAGDRLLRALTDTATGVSRKGDIVGRLGGDEFALALADADAGLALALAELIRRAVVATRLDDGAGGFTVSIGVASMRGAESLDELFAEADAALYRAKAQGGNSVAAVPADTKVLRSLLTRGTRDDRRQAGLKGTAVPRDLSR